MSMSAERRTKARRVAYLLDLVAQLGVGVLVLGRHGCFSGCRDTGFEEREWAVDRNRLTGEEKRGDAVYGPTCPQRRPQRTESMPRAILSSIPDTPSPSQRS